MDDSIGKDSLVRFNQPSHNYLKVAVGKNIHNLTKSDRKQSIDTTIIKNGSTGGYIMQQWNIECQDRNIAEKK